MTWKETPRDLDLYLIPIDGEDLTPISYRNLGSLSRPPWAKLNTDIRNGLGPEVISIGRNISKKYLVAVHNYSAESELCNSLATVRIDYLDLTKIFHCPNNKNGRYWHVCLIDCSTGIINEINQLGEIMGIYP